MPVLVVVRPGFSAEFKETIDMIKHTSRQLQLTFITREHARAAPPSCENLRPVAYGCVVCDALPEDGQSVSGLETTDRL